MAERGARRRRAARATTARSHPGARPRPGALAAALAALLLAASGCGTSGGGATLTVFAAASLTEVFERLGPRFEEEHPGTRVEFNFAGSSDLAEQVNQGAPADVFASANPATMDSVVEAGNAEGDPEVFAHNTLEIAVPPENPAGVTGLDDLGAPDVRVAMCAEEVPCGAAAHTVMDETGVRITPVSEEQDVKAALTKVRLGEVDAALVYRTDVAAAGDDVRGIPFDAADTAVNDYPVAVLANAPEPDLARDWVRYLRSTTGTKALDAAGFGVPEAG